MKPLIGITGSRTVDKGWGLYSLGRYMDFAFNAYSSAILHSGGIPTIVPCFQDIESIYEIIRKLDGLLLSGGPDMHPKFYGEEPMPTMGEIDEEIDTMQLEACKMALQRNIPMLGICRGIQILNVSLGGTLYQDFPTQLSDTVCHRQKADGAINFHSIHLEENTTLRQLLKKETLTVNSHHHQAIKNLGLGLSVAARATDGIIEAVEHPAKKFVLGVQWHPEGTFERDDSSKLLFKTFIQAAV